MSEGPGKAGGPQRRPRREAPKDGDSFGRPDTRTDEDRARQSYGACRARMTEESERLSMRLAEMTPAEHLRAPPSIEQLAVFYDIEARLTSLRLQLDQSGCAI